ncbi:hypothetical protein F4824DRAFT_510963 [Ustulina deusta]|nr:hypothetical protein F4824DRAFT_510963 [Ustulina deusta]
MIRELLSKSSLSEEHFSNKNKPVMDYWVLGNPFNFGRLRATLHYKRDEHGAVAESKADVILEAPCSTVEAIDKLASTKQWLLKYELLRPALRNVLEISPVSRQQLLLSRQGQHVSLTVGGDFGLACICGKDEVQAVSEMMTEDQYWIVDLYLSDITYELRCALEVEYAHEPTDGTIYYKIREFQGIFKRTHENQYLEQRWWARLPSKDRLDRMKQVLQGRNQQFADAFDALYPLKALHKQMRLSVFNRIVLMRCPEEYLCSLNWVKEFWYYVFDKDLRAMELLDPVSLGLLQLTAPGACETEPTDLHW